MARARSSRCSPLDDGPQLTWSPTEVKLVAQGGRPVLVNSADQQELGYSPTRLLSCHQTPQGEFPPPPTLWMPRLLPPGPTPPWIRPRPSARSARRSAFKEEEEERSSQTEWDRTSDDGVDDPTHFLNYYRRRSSLAPPTWSRSAHLDPRWDPLKWKRLQDLAQSMSSPVEDQQYYAAQAQKGSGKVRYESCRSLAILGCLHRRVILELVNHLEDPRREERLDTLRGLSLALNIWVKGSINKREPVGAKARLSQALEQLMGGQDPGDDVALEAAVCLAFLDPQNTPAKRFLVQCLTVGDKKRRMKALLLLIRQFQMGTAAVIHAAMYQLRHAWRVQHRIEAAGLLQSIGLLQIQAHGLEEAVFKLLLEKVYDEPFLEVRQAVVEAVESFQMKSRMLDIVELQVEDTDTKTRRQAVLSLGVLGIRTPRLFHYLLDMLDLEKSEQVRVELDRMFAALAMRDPWVLEKLKSRLPPVKKPLETSGASLRRKTQGSLPKMEPPGSPIPQLSPQSEESQQASPELLDSYEFVALRQSASVRDLCTQTLAGSLGGQGLARYHPLGISDPWIKAQQASCPRRSSRSASKLPRLCLPLLPQRRGASGQ
ncbi:protein HEATR9 isoform X2 [Tachyglossus aculeatus]|uniref:protein HEATR9 isoform X2 n=1 Tax=Tachyglossus aculeatus TaxID=9261 RepID=UPI0018F63D4C|nr:protein HEATR9 isoform X2 [Tachyglossus aculeatus]